MEVIICSKLVFGKKCFRKKDENTSYALVVASIKVVFTDGNTAFVSPKVFNRFSVISTIFCWIKMQIFRALTTKMQFLKVYHLKFPSMEIFAAYPFHTNWNVLGLARYSQYWIHNVFISRCYLVCLKSDSHVPENFCQIKVIPSGVQKKWHHLLFGVKNENEWILKL